MAQVSTRPSDQRGPVRRFLYCNGLSLAVTALFFLTAVGQTLTGMFEYNHELMDHGRPEVPLTQYMVSGHFVEAIAENWESEFLQMAVYVLLTMCLFQKGSSESKKIGEPASVDRDPRRVPKTPDMPWPVLRGGWVLRLYENSLSLTFLLLFLISFGLHAAGGTSLYNEQQLEHGAGAVTIAQYMTTSQFWFESFQNWQSEFLSLTAIVVLSIYLRQRGSPESKPVDAPHCQTGDE
jgi:uncharacterized protein DUF6766